MPFLILCCLMLWSCTAPVEENLESTTSPLSEHHDSIATLPLQALPLFEDATGNFAVYFPNPPQQQTQSSEVDIGALTMTQWVSKDASGQYYVLSYADYPKAVLKLGSDKQLLKGVKERLLSTLHAQQQHSAPVLLDSLHKGIAFQAIAKRKHWHLDYHLYLVNQRLYQLGIHSALGPIPQQDSLDFFGNFKLIK